MKGVNAAGTAFTGAVWLHILITLVSSRLHGSRISSGLLDTIHPRRNQ
jgi:hypothetical protein